MSNFCQSFLLKNEPSGTYPLNPSGQSRWAGSGGVLGGKYVLTTCGTGSGTAALYVTGPDGVTQIEVSTSITSTSSAQSLDLPPGSYTMIFTGFTANYASLTRVPY